MTRILILGDLAQTGFGTVTTDLGRALLARGEDVRFVPLNDHAPDALPEPFASRARLLGHEPGWIANPKTDAEALAMVGRLQTIFEPWPDGWTPEGVILIGDVASLKMSLLPDLIPAGMTALHYVPIEGVGLPPRWAETWAGMRPVAMSEFGADQIATIYPERPPVVYHGVDTEAFYPVSAQRPIVFTNPAGVLTVLRSKDDCKQFFGRDPRRTLLLRADANVPRKRYPSLFRSLAPVLAAHPEVDLICHCRIIDEGGDLLDERSKYPPTIAERIIPSGFRERNKALDRKALNALYNAADLYVSVSAEGFGLTIAESLAAGVPALALDYSSVPEVVGPAGVLVPAGGLVDTQYSMFWAGVNEAEYAKAAEFLVTHKARRNDLGRLGPAHVASHFSWARAADQFVDLIRIPEVVAA